MKIRDTRNGSWFWVNTAVNACPHISSTDKVVYGAICTLAGCEEIHPSYEEISRRSAVSVRQCKDSVQKLIKVGYVSVKKGGGKGNANVYSLLKVPKGCTSCTESKGCTESTQTVQNTSSNGADSAPQLDKEVDKDIATEVATEKFDTKKYIRSLRDSPQAHIRLIGFFFYKKGVAFDSAEEADVAMRQHLKYAIQAVKSSPEKISEAVRVCEKMDVDWTVSTILKTLTKMSWTQKN